MCTYFPKEQLANKDKNILKTRQPGPQNLPLKTKKEKKEGGEHSVSILQRRA